jgi:hypothetical protein
MPLVRSELAFGECSLHQEFAVEARLR